MLVRRRSVTSGERLLLGVLLAGIAFAGIVAVGGNAQLYFLRFGYMAALILSAGCLYDLARWSRGDRGVSVLIAIASAASALVAGMIVLGTAVNPEPVEPGTIQDLLVVVVLLAAAFGAAAAIAVSSARSRAGIAVFVATLLAAASFDHVVDVAVPTLQVIPADLHKGANPPSTSGVTPALAEGLEWVRTETDEEDVLAVNTQASGQFPDGSPFYRSFLYAAFGERQLVLGGWEYTTRGRSEDEPERSIEEIKSRSDALLAASSCAEFLPALARAPSQWALYDRYNAREPEALRELIAPTFGNRGLAVYDLEAAKKECVSR